MEKWTLGSEQTRPPLTPRKPDILLFFQSGTVSECVIFLGGGANIQCNTDMKKRSDKKHGLKNDLSPCRWCIPPPRSCLLYVYSIHIEQITGPAVVAILEEGHSPADWPASIRRTSRRRGSGGFLSPLDDGDMNNPGAGSAAAAAARHRLQQHHLHELYIGRRQAAGGAQRVAKEGAAASWRTVTMYVVCKSWQYIKTTGWRDFLFGLAHWGEGDT